MKNLRIVLIVIALLIGVLLVLPKPTGSLPESPVDTPTESSAAGDADAGPVPDPAPPGRFAITNVRLFDGTRVIENAAVVVDAGRVVAAGRMMTTPIPDGTTVIDGSGRTALPGLIDAHVHSFGTAQSDALRFGVTTLLDMFRAPEDFEEQHLARASTEPTGRADLFSAGYLATAEGGHGTQYGIDVPLPAGPDRAQAWVDARLAEGSDWIKIVIEGGRAWGGRTPSLDAATVSALVEAAHRRDVLAVAHVSTRAEADLAVAAGVDGLVHLFIDEAVDPATAEDWAERGLFIVPTLPVLASALGQAGMERLAGFDDARARLSSEQRRSLGAVFPNAAQRSAQWSGVAASIPTLQAAGVRLLAGSDAPNPGTAHGLSLIDAVIRLHEAGLSPLEALRAATSAPAAVFPIGPRGCLRPGCRADLVLVAGDPSSDPTALLDIVGVWKNGAEVALGIDAAPPSDTPPADEPAAAVDLLADPSSWMASADDFMGGASEAAIEPMDGALRVTGTLREGFAFPYAGAMWSAGASIMQPVDRRGWSTLTLDVESDAELLRVMFFSGGNPQPIWLDVEPAAAIEIDLAGLTGLDLAAFQAVGVFVAEPTGAFESTIIEARFE
ncbi:amidohydrolase family protein [Wenzhouxiangella sp. XN79A]|uniref:amidohydrolase family protein n=1 Tax=Wenzhouxiangella sp. XN79A TaxID=2724193 RepID=UPI00144A8D71|nr:amidohydrolase family protein [Wenzhouxiangella sp. XN79A]NKI36123.1 amidohydrolase family protein [Wenzhouxiangella sp. XN79A]